MGVTASNLAAILYHLKRPDEAVALQTLAVDALRRSVGPDHQRTILALGNLGVFKRAKGDWPSALADYRDLLARQTRLQGPEHPRTTFATLQLAIVLKDAGRAGRDTAHLVEARGLLRDVARRFEASVGPTHRDLGSALYQLAIVESALGRSADAVGAARRATAILAAAQGDTARATVAARRLLDSLESAGAR